MGSRVWIIAVLLVSFLFSVCFADTLPADFYKPIGKTIKETREIVCPGVEHIHRQTADPLNIHILVVDIETPGISIKPCLSQDHAAGLETVSSMVIRKGAVAGVNGDYWTYNGIPLGLTIIDSEIIIAPKFRTAFGIRQDGTPVIGKWTDKWSWEARVIAPDGASHEIVMMNSDCNPGWLCLYTDKYGMPSKGNSVSPVTEVFCNLEHRVIEMRTDMPGKPIPSGGFVLTGRDDAGKWLREHIKPGDHIILDLKSTPPWQELQQAIGAGPCILKDGKFYQDPVKPFPEGEEFTLEWKKGHYYNRYPRTAIGVSKDKNKVILVTVDGRQPEFSIGVYQKQMADLLLEFGAWDGMDLDSGGSTTMVIKGKVVNHPSDYAKPDGTGGVERRVANGLLIFYTPPAQQKPLPGTVTKEQQELNIKY